MTAKISVFSVFTKTLCKQIFLETVGFTQSDKLIVVYIWIGLYCTE